ncbi:hypothetical protein BRADI_4g19615v3 [Brachypodium distachyon]|uniref:Uncharacterized protein n=1 Tax=Brachypodium distachyon TaxID=15368 RepID=A0A2K2CNN4_BRADI|nr:hypothetical protein BRADI_4g19615v3 [Brachypodium distachyon]
MRAQDPPHYLPPHGPVRAQDVAPALRLPPTSIRTTEASRASLPSPGTPRRRGGAARAHARASGYPKRAASKPLCRPSRFLSAASSTSPPHRTSAPPILHAPRLAGHLPCLRPTPPRSIRPTPSLPGQAAARGSTAPPPQDH